MTDQIWKPTTIKPVGSTNEIVRQVMDKMMDQVKSRAYFTNVDFGASGTAICKVQVIDGELVITPISDDEFYVKSQ